MKGKNRSRKKSDQVYSFIVEIKQFPPIFSALKYKGQRAYKLARENKEVKLKPRLIKVNKFEFNKDSIFIIPFSSVVEKTLIVNSNIINLPKGKKRCPNGYRMNKNDNKCHKK